MAIEALSFISSLLAFSSCRMKKHYYKLVKITRGIIVLNHCRNLARKLKNKHISRIKSGTSEIILDMRPGCSGDP